MKISIVIAIILVSLQCNGQNWNRHSVYPAKEYPFEYEIQFENKYDTSSHILVKKIGYQKSKIKLYNSNGEPIIAASIKLNHRTTDIENDYISDLDGESEVLLQQGKYLLEISTTYNRKFKLEFDVEQNQYISLEIDLGIGSELDVYLVNSKTELSRSKLLEIKDCIRLNMNRFNKICSRRREFRVMKQI